MMTGSIRHEDGSCRKQLGEGDLGQGGRKTRAISGAVFGLLIGYAASGAVDVAAQQAIGFGVTSTNPNVFVNNDVLNSLGPGGPAGVLPYYGGGIPSAGGYGGQAIVSPQGNFVLTRPGTLLFPPAAYPRSHLVNRNAAVALTQAPAGAAAAARPKLTAPQLRPPKQSAPQVAAEQTPGTADLPPAKPRPKAQTQVGAAPPPPVPAGSKQASAEASAPPPPKPADLTAAIPAPPDPSSEGAIVAEADTGAQLTPPPPPEIAAESPDAASDAVSAAAVPSPPTASASESPATQEVALPPAGEDPAEGELRLLFTPGKADLSQEVKSALQVLAKTLVSDGNARVQLLAYATSSEDSPSRARRLSLSRALAVRAYLIDQGVRSTRMDVRALGDKAENDPKDRVDIQPARR